jgi:hypothetical protein
MTAKYRKKFNTANMQDAGLKLQDLSVSNQLFFYFIIGQIM